MNVAIVVPTNRPEKIEAFKLAWKEQFEKYDVSLYIVNDGENPTVDCPMSLTKSYIMGKYEDLIYNFNDGVRNLGFAMAYRDGADVIISLDDDTTPCGDTIGDHLRALEGRFPISWMNTANEVYMRGFPYKLRKEAECVLSHGVWNGVADFDASTQLVLGTPELTYRRMPVPKGVLFPMCIMNVAFKRKMTPYMYQAPMKGDVNRFADIWGGIYAKRAIDYHEWAAVTGYATVNHERASNPFANLIKEAKGVSMNEDLVDFKDTKDFYFAGFEEKIIRWQKFLKQYD